MKLRFPPLSGGVIQGLNDAGIETFEGDYAHFVVRESAQNSLDAAASPDHPVRLEFAVHSLPTGDLPFLPALQDTLRECQTFWRDQAKPREFFERASRIARQEKIYALRVSDFGTTGVPGGDLEMNKPWFGLVRSRGVSIKADEASAGAFGIGKDAPLAASAFRTVIYSSRTRLNEVAAQGICRLASHKRGQDLTQGTGFIGNFDEATRQHSALRSEREIQRPFLRDEPGLDVWILGFRYESEWETPFVAAALYNFWPAIHLGKLVISIGDVLIDSHTLAPLIEDYKHLGSVGEALPYYKSLVRADSRRVETRLSTAGDCRLHVHLGKADLPRKICMTRKTGMVIYHYSPRIIRVPFAGLFQCDDQKGNQLLKALEPPRHDKWEPKRATNPNEKQAIEEIKAWIRDSLRAMIPDIDSDLVNEDTIADLLPDEELPGPADSDAGEGELGGLPAQPEAGNKAEVTPPSIRVRGQGSGGKDQDGEGGEEGDEVTDPDEGDNESSGGRRKRRSARGSKGGGAVRRSPKIDLRCYRDSAAESSTYHLVARASEDYVGDLLIDAVTEEGGGVPCPLVEAYGEDGQPLVVTGSKISGVSIPENTNLRLKIVLATTARFALRASTT
jgi:hypothetical protein